MHGAKRGGLAGMKNTQFSALDGDTDDDDDESSSDEEEEIEEANNNWRN